MSIKYDELACLRKSDSLTKRLNVLCKNKNSTIMVRLIVYLYTMVTGIPELLLGRQMRRKILNDSTKKYSLGIVAIAKNESEYIREWVAFHKLVGVSVIFLYDNESTDNMKECISDYIDSGYVVYQKIEGKNRQYDAYNDALFRYGRLCKYMAFIDCDEFLTPCNRGDNLLDYLDSAVVKNKNAGGIGINWCMYGSSGYLEKPKGLLIERFIWRADTVNGKGNNCIKTIAIPECIKLFNHPHYPIYRYGFYNVDLYGHPVSGAYNRITQYYGVKINHYFTKSKEQWIIRRSMGMADKNAERTISEFYEHDNNDVKDLSAAIYSKELYCECNKD